MKVEGENNYAGKRKYTTISKQTDAIPERDFESMVPAPDLKGDSGHAAEARHHNLPSGNFPFHQAAQEQIRSESRTAEETGAISKSLTFLGKAECTVTGIGEGTDPRFLRSSPRI